LHAHNQQNASVQELRVLSEYDFAFIIYYIKEYYAANHNVRVKLFFPLLSFTMLKISTLKTTNENETGLKENHVSCVEYN
jgi:hypothetical protein